MKIKKGDHVRVITGKDKGKTGKVSRALPKEDKVVVDGINMRKVHRRSRQQGKKGEIIEVAMPIHVSNVALHTEKTSPKKTVTRKTTKKAK